MSTLDPATAAGALDASLIAQLANELFRAAPNGNPPPSGPGSAAPSVPGFAAVAAPSLTSAPTRPSLNHNGGALPSVPGHLAVALPSAPLASNDAPAANAAPSLVPIAPTPTSAIGQSWAPAGRPTPQTIGSAAQTVTPGPGVLPAEATFLSVPEEFLALIPSRHTTAALEPNFAVPARAPEAAPGVSSDVQSFGFLESGAGSNAPFASDIVAFAPVQQSLPQKPPIIPATGTRPLEPLAIKREFPILQQQVHGKPLIWLDNAATTQKPQLVIDRLSEFYSKENSNIHRAAHALAARSTDAYEAAREKVRRFINAPSVKDIIFVRGTTEGINLIAQAWGRRNVGEGDEIIVTHLEHHANIVPWQQLAAEKGARLRVAPVDDTGQVILEEYERLFNPKTRIVSFTHVSNALGTITPAAEMIAIAHRHGVPVVLDGAQSVSHMPIDVQALDADFFVLSGHKMFGPTGIGAVYGKSHILETMPPWQGGGNMIADVTFEKTVYQGAPERFEAGTGNIADAVGLGAAIDYLDRLGMANVAAYEHELLLYATDGLLTVPGLKLIGTAKEKAGVLSFVLDGCRTEDVGKALDQEGIAVRSGHHCAQPILRRFGLESTVRPSLAIYNTRDDIDALVKALLRIQSGRGRRLT